MSRAMTPRDERADHRLLDEETWDSPGRLTDADLYAHAGAARRRGGAALDDPEDDR